MDAKVYELLNHQINQELYSAYLYMAFANYYEEEGLGGFANWYMIQAGEEKDHALKIRTYLHENGCKVKLSAVEAPGMEFANYTAPLEAGLQHEKYVTSLINAIYEAAHEVRDFRTMKFLDWFITEQGEEEATAEEMLTKMKLFGSDAKALYELDKEYGARVATATAAE